MERLTSNIREECLNILRNTLTIGTMSLALNKRDRQAIVSEIQQISKKPRKELKVILPQYRAGLDRLKKQVGWIGEPEDIEEYEDTLSQEERFPVIWIPKWKWQAQFSYHEDIPILKVLPPHGLLGIDVDLWGDEEVRLDPSDKVIHEIDWSLMEAELFWDVVTLWNCIIDVSSASKNDIVALRPYLRACLKACFSLLEGYMNGLGSDLYLTQTIKESDKKHFKDFASEGGYTSIKEKILHFPRVALGVKDPPLQPSNCKAFSNMLDFEEAIRHSLIHPIPSFQVGPNSIAREEINLQLNISNVGEVIDNTNRLILKIDETINHMFGGVDWWLTLREDGKKMQMNRKFP